MNMENTMHDETFQDIQEFLDACQDEQVAEMTDRYYECDIPDDRYY